MKNLFFAILSFVFFMTSCTKEFVEPTVADISSVSVRTQPVQITGTVAAVEIGIDDIEIHLVNWDNSPEGLTPVEIQNLAFQNIDGEVINVASEVTAVEIGIDDIEIHLVVPTDELSNLTLIDNQTFDFN